MKERGEGMIQRVIFDFDGTIANSNDLAWHIYHKLAPKYCKQVVEKEAFWRIMELPLLERVRLLEVPIYRIPRIARDCLVEYQNYLASLEIFSGMAEVLQKLKESGYAISIISSNSVENIRYFLGKYQLLDLFDTVIHEKNIFGKDRSIKKHIKKMSHSAEQVLYVGDELRDIEASKKVGVKIISVAWGFDNLSLLCSGKPDFIAYQPQDIWKIAQGVY